MNASLPPRRPTAADPWRTAEAMALRGLMTITALLIVIAHRPHVVIAVPLLACAVIVDVVRWRLRHSRRQEAPGPWWRRASTPNLVVYGIMAASFLVAAVSAMLPGSSRAICEVMDIRDLATVSALAAAQFQRIPAPCDQSYMHSFFIIYLLFPLGFYVYAVSKSIIMASRSSYNYDNVRLLFVDKRDIGSYSFAVQMLIMASAIFYNAIPYAGPERGHVLHVYSSIFGILLSNIVLYIGVSAFDALLYIEHQRRAEERLP